MAQVGMYVIVRYYLRNRLKHTLRQTLQYKFDYNSVQNFRASIIEVKLNIILVILDSSFRSNSYKDDHFTSPLN